MIDHFQHNHTSLMGELRAMTNPFKLLLVDDSPANLTLLIDYLTKAHFQLFVAESGPSALERLQHIQPDLILLDILMPVMSGFELCKLIKANPATSQIPIIFLTARDETADKLKGFAIGGVDYITKPLVEEEVLARVHTHLQLAQTQQRLLVENAQLQQALTQRTLAAANPPSSATEPLIAPAVQLSLFDNFQLVVNGEQRSAFRSDLVRALFAYLVLEGQQPLERTYLAHWFWPTYLPYTRLNSLRVAIHNLRQLLKPFDQLLLADRKTIQFMLDPAWFWCDALRLDQGQRGDLPPPISGTAASSTPAFGSFLLNFDHIESHAFQKWRQQKQRHYAAIGQH